MESEEQLIVDPANEPKGGLNLKLLFIGLVVVFIAVFALLYIIDSISRLRSTCTVNSSMSICKINTFQLIILMLLLISAGLIIVISITAYILLTGRRQV
jgi:hypothetical protein